LRPLFCSPRLAEQITFGEMKWRVLVTVCLIFAGCESAPLGVESAGYVVVPSARAVAVIGYTEEWQPKAAQIARLEKEIGRLFDRPDKRMTGVFTRNGLPPKKAPLPLSDYFVRYCGVIKDGKKLIVGKASHRLVGDAGRILSIPDEHIVELPPFGGGTAFFTVTFDLETNRILNLAYASPM
jgi:hypothetical protein